MEDSQIIALFQQRREEAIAAVREKYSAYCAQIAGNILGNSEDTEEVLNDLWLRVWNTIPPQEPYALRSFLAKITRNLALDRYRAETSEKRGGGKLHTALEELETCVPGGLAPETALDAKQLQLDIGRFLATLSPRDRSIFLRRYFYMESTWEIAEKYGLRENAVLTVLSRARKKLKDYLRKEGYGL